MPVRISLPEQVQYLIETLEAHGHEAYAVGGCVRDSILGREPKDWDITTDAAPREVKTIFPRCIDTGIQHGTVTVMLQKTGYEVTTYRIDGSYSDGRHPDSVAFTSKLSEDLRRRDFTINAMAYSESAGLVDLFSGLSDLEQGIVRAVGVPKERFTEDALRILRMVRFSSQLGFEIDQETLQAAADCAAMLPCVSKERVREEFMKTLLSDHPEKLLLLQKIGAMEYIFPELSRKLSEASADPSSVLPENLPEFPKDAAMRLSALFYRIGEGKSAEENVRLSEQVLRSLRFDNDTIRSCGVLLRFSSVSLSPEPRELRQLLSESGKKDFPMILAFRRLIQPGDGEKTLFDQVEESFLGIVERGECTSISELQVNGKDLQGLGIRPGKALGACLNELLRRVLQEPSLNTKEQLLALAEGLLPRT